MFKPRLTALALIAATLAAGGCATVPSETTDKPARESITFNRMKLTPVDNVRVPGMGLLPFDGSLEDVAALAEVTKLLRREITEAILRDEFELAGVLNAYYGQFAALRLALNIATQQAVDELGRTEGAAFTLQPGSVVVLLSNNPTQQAAGPISLGNPFESILTRGPSVEVAAKGVGAVLEAMRIISETTGKGSGGQVTGRASTTFGLDAIPANIPFALENGTVLVRRETAKGMTYAFYNPTDRAAEVPLKNLAYVPPPPPFKSQRQAAGPILYNFGESMTAEIRRRISIGAEPHFTHYFSTTLYPGGPMLDSMGRITTDPEAHAEAVRESKRLNSPFRVAAGLSSRTAVFAYNKGCAEPYAEFDKWLTSGQRGPAPYRPTVFIYPAQRYFGNYSAFVKIDCTERRTDRVFYTQNYFVGEEGVVQTAQSLAADARIAKKLKEFDSDSEAVADMMTILPVAGSAVSGLRCAASSKGVTEGVVAALRPQLAAARPYVAHLYDLAKTDSAELFGETTGRILDCAAAVPAFGTVTSIIGKYAGGSLTSLMKNDKARKALETHVSANWDNVGRVAGYFSTPITTPGHVNHIIEASQGLTGKAKSAVVSGLSIYGVMQKADNVSDFKSGLENAPWKRRD